MRKWTKTEVLHEIQQLYAEGEPLNYQAIERTHLGLVRAATHLWGSWGQAVKAAGIEYDKIRKYQEWDKERVKERIRWWHRKGADLSWSHVSRTLDPALGAAALRPKQFGSWEAAIRAAGLDYRHVSRYRRWNREGVIQRLARRKAEGQSLKVGEVQAEEPTLVAAARRWFRDWNAALSAAAEYDKAVRGEYSEVVR